MTLLTLSDFIGRFHPVLVHLPIGILLLACFLQWLGTTLRYTNLLLALPLITFWGMLSAIAACISGYFLTRSGDYDELMVNRHLYSGIGVAVAAILLYWLQKKAVRRNILRSVSVLLVLLVIFAGHLGGSITHGSDYLSFSVIGNNEYGSSSLQPIPNIQEANVYMGVVRPILEARCLSCHGPSKQKGKLRLDDTTYILKGGENGAVIVGGKSGESEMINRILLPLDNDDHMPPKGKPQPSADEIAILQWWIDAGVDFHKKVNEIGQNEQIIGALLALEAGASSETSEMTELPEEPVPPADTSVIGKLQRVGVMVMPVSQNTNYLSVSFIAADSSSDHFIRQLEPLKEQLLWLKLDGTLLTDAGMEIIDAFPKLTRLQLANTEITDEGLIKLQKLERLQHLNLVGTRVTAAGVAQLKNLKALKTLYLYRTSVNPSDWRELQQIFSETTIDTGGYSLPMLASDTTTITTSPAK